MPLLLLLSPLQVPVQHLRLQHGARHVVRRLRRRGWLPRQRDRDAGDEPRVGALRPGASTPPSLRVLLRLRAGAYKYAPSHPLSVQMPTMALATALQLLFYAMVLIYTVRPVECLASGCTAPSSDEPGRHLGHHGHGGGEAQPPPPRSCFSGTASTLPVGCGGAGGVVPCATCVPYAAEGGQECAVGWHQCQWLHGDAEPPAPLDVAFMLVALVVFQVRLPLARSHGAPHVLLPLLTPSTCFYPPLHARRVRAGG